MRNNPYNKSLKDHMPLFMQGPSSVSVLLANEEQKNFIEKAKQIPKKTYQIRNVSFAMINPPVLNKNFTVNPPDLLKTEMGQTEVTQELFQAVMGWNDSKNKRPQNPVEQVNWYDCISFCNKLSTLLGFKKCYKISDIEMDSVHIIEAKVQWNENKNGFRLPTEYEWELFAKAGTDNQWSGTNDENALIDYAWYNRNSGRQPNPVGRKLPNEWGLCDMTGNVWEWCWDLYDPDDTERRVMRGGCYGNFDTGCEVEGRFGVEVNYRPDYHGFRLCRSLG